MDWPIFWAAVAAVATIAALYFGVRTYLRSFPKRSLRYEVENIPILSDGSSALVGVRILLGNREFKNPWLTTVTVRSHSRADIESASFDSGRPIVFTSSLPLYVSQGTKAGVDNIGFDWVDYNDGTGTVTLSIRPQLIRPKARGSFVVLSDGEPRFEVDPSLINIDVDERATSQPDSKVLRRVAFFAWGTAGALGAACWLVAEQLFAQ
jgi:hypothetical protein